MWQILGKYPIWGQYYRVEAEITMYDLPNATWLNVFHFTENDNCCQLGHRIPALMIHQDGYFHICSGVNDIGDYCFDYNFKIGNKYHIVIQQKPENYEAVIYKIIVNNQIIHKVQNIQLKEYTDVHVYVSDPWHSPFSSEYGLLENFSILPNLNCWKDDITTLPSTPPICEFIRNWLNEQYKF